jgi:hypothetical protein
MARKLSLILLLSAVVALSGCPQSITLPPATEGGGFIVETQDQPIPGAPYVVVGGITMQGDWQPPYVAGAQGDPHQWTETSNPLGLIPLPGKMAPSYWKETWKAGGDPQCLNVYDTGYIYLDEVNTFVCVYQRNFGLLLGVGFGFNPTPVYTWSPPNVATISGSGLDLTYGWPIAQYYSMDGTLLAQDTASYVSGDGTSMQVPGTDVSQLSYGTYAGFASNAGPNSTWNYAGVATVQVESPNVTIYGYVTQVYSDPCWPNDSCPFYYPDSGNVSITLNGSMTYSTSYGYWTSFSDELAVGLAGAINADPNAPVTATVVDLVDHSTIYLTDKSTGSLTSVSAGTDSQSFPAVAAGPGN